MNTEVVYLTKMYNSAKFTEVNSEIREFVIKNFFTFKHIDKDKITFTDVDGMLEFLPRNYWLVVSASDPAEYYILDEEDYRKMFKV